VATVHIRYTIFDVSEDILSLSLFLNQCSVSEVHQVCVWTCALPVGTLVPWKLVSLRWLLQNTGGTSFMFLTILTFISHKITAYILVHWIHVLKCLQYLYKPCLGLYHFYFIYCIYSLSAIFSGNMVSIFTATLMTPSSNCFSAV